MSKKLIFLILIIINITSIFAGYTYESSGSNKYQTQTTLNHGEQTSVKYIVQSTNSLCSMSCSVRLTSDYENTNTLDFNLGKGAGTELTFYISAPSKSEANYEPSGQVIYELDVSCYDEDSLLCDGSKQKGEDISETTTDYKIIYELSDADETKKKEIEGKLESLKKQINEFHEDLYSLESKYNNANSKILVKNIESDIKSLNSKYDKLKSSEDSIKSKYDKLDFYSAIQTYNSMPSYNHYSTMSDISDLEDEIDEAQKKHNELVSNLNSLNTKLKKSNDEAYLFKLNSEYKTLITSYESLLNKLNKLQFSSYTTLDNEINTFGNKINTFENNLKSEKESVLEKLKNSFISEYEKIEENNKIDSYSSEDIIKDYCNEFKSILPPKFNTYNENKEKEVLEINQKRLQRNSEIDSYTSKWNELSNLIIQIENLSKNNEHDVINNPCNTQITALQNLDLSLANIEKTIQECKVLKTNLEANIEENKGFLQSISNFFSSLFSDKVLIEIPELKSLESFKNNEEYKFEIVSFSSTSKSLSETYCNINIEKVTLESSKSVGEIEKDYYAGGDVVDFATKESECDNNKCYADEDGYPILFVHGHLFDAKDDPLKESINVFDDLIRYIADEDDNFYDAGKIVSAGSINLGNKAGKTPDASMYRTTYYGGAISSNGGFVWENKKYDSISKYAEKLEETIDSTLELTNRKQVKIVAHSMGGLVVREYIRKNGDDKINTFIMIGTPNQGVEGNVASNCYEGVGNGAETECKEMQKGSSFLSKLNSMSRSDLPSKTYIISGVYLNEDTDGIVTYENTKISGVENYKKTTSETKQWDWVEGIGASLGEDYPHSQLVDPDYAPNTAKLVVELLG